MSYQSADQLVAEFSDTNITTWESKLDYELVQEIVGRSMTMKEWRDLAEKLDDIIFETVMTYQHD